MQNNKTQKMTTEQLFMVAQQVQSVPITSLGIDLDIRPIPATAQAKIQSMTLSAFKSKAIYLKILELTSRGAAEEELAELLLEEGFTQADILEMNEEMTENELNLKCEYIVASVLLLENTKAAEIKNKWSQAVIDEIYDAIVSMSGLYNNNATTDAVEDFRGDKL